MELQHLFAPSSEDLCVKICNTINNEEMPYAGGCGLTAAGFADYSDIMDITLEETGENEYTAVCLDAAEWAKVRELLEMAIGGCSPATFRRVFCDLTETVVQDEDPEDISPCVGCSLEFTTDCRGCKHWRGNND